MILYNDNEQYTIYTIIIFIKIIQYDIKVTKSG